MLMRARLLCILCTLRAAYNMVKRSTENEEVQRRVLLEALRWLSKEAENLASVTPAALHTYAFKIVQRVARNKDPFLNLKKMSNNLAMKIVPILRREISGKRPEEAVRIAALGAVFGNSIDFEVEGYHAPMEDLERALLSCLRSRLAIDDTANLIEMLPKSKKILYLLDNSGEIAFDKILIDVIVENYPVKVIAAVKSGPVLNDATMEDALEVGLQEHAEVITTGSDSVGLNLEETSEDFKVRLKEADIIIAKGQGHYESMTEYENSLGKPVVYMLRAKCPVVAEALSVPQGSNVIKIVKRS